PRPVPGRRPAGGSHPRAQRADGHGPVLEGAPGRRRAVAGAGRRRELAPVSTGAKGNGAAAPDDAHEWVSFDDPEEDRTWIFDVTFLLSHWGCIFGRGCQGVLTGPTPELAQGCCSYGAHFVDAADRRRVERAAKTMTPDEWQFRRQGLARGVTKTNQKGESMTRLVDGACVFLNRPGFGSGPGCALHYAAAN